MIPRRYTIKAKKPDGSPVLLCRRTDLDIIKIKEAMMNKGYNDIKITRDPTPSEAVLQGLMITQKCNFTKALNISLHFQKAMIKSGVIFARKDDLK